MEAFHGVKKELHLRMNISCTSCDGSGAEKGSKRVTCSVCKGQGRVVRVQQTPFGAFQTAVPCGTCEGVGTIPEKICHSCSGKGIVTGERIVSIDVPQGIDDGETIRIHGMGESAPFGNSSGDLYVHVHVKKDPKFIREGNDIRSSQEAPVSIFALGGSVRIETVDGGVMFSVPAGTTSGNEFKLKGQGFTSLHGRGRGDHYVTLQPLIPKKLTREQKDALEALKKSGL
jgi:molecular chaperone DnaJ